jgi:hypothetical protein
MKYTIIIRNNETNEVVFEKEANAMIAGLAGEDMPSSILIKGTHDENLMAMNIVQNEFNRIYEDED